ncbi:late competence development ComFB family protein [Thiomicrorhabdus sp. zzn3]|uniref:late competence development ComFB family protein n=1 Tax=Thiomicrorhabdus sp. zzn3 TaxID=3039775 RepID=UPI002436ABC2|nr:late competence development ComFB family protein [Thiomicrorhabdus sp. zzn3]MDG6779070.1 late competence development ComFB family protein [Thiomicrorhabdus sp. zzn3]
MTELEFESVHNYYERLVFNEISEKYQRRELDADQLADVACVALNMIPPRYIRHAIDMSFYSYGNEHEEMEKKAKEAVAKAYDEIKKLDGVK